jgi:hypothetical protein
LGYTKPLTRQGHAITLVEKEEGKFYMMCDSRPKNLTEEVDIDDEDLFYGFMVVYARRKGEFPKICLWTSVILNVCMLGLFLFSNMFYGLP